MKIFERLVPLVLIMLILAGAVGCGNTAKPAASAPAPATGAPAANAGKPWTGKKLGIVHISMNDEWCKSVYDEFYAQGEALGFVINVQNGDGKPEQQQQLVETFIAQKYDMILVNPCSPAGIVPSLKKAGEANIPVLAFDSNSEYEQQVSWIAQDHADLGVQSAKYTIDYVKEKLGGKVKIGLLQSLGAPHVKVRGDKFLETFEAGLGKENITYVYDQEYGGTREGAGNVVSNNIAKPIDIIWTALETSALGARPVLASNNMPHVQIICADGWGQEIFSLIYQGDPNFRMAIGAPPPEIVKLALQTACEHFEGKKDIPKVRYIKIEPIDYNNISAYVEKYVPADVKAKLVKGPNVK